MAGDWYEQGALLVARGLASFENDVIKAVVCDSGYVPNLTTDSLLADLSHEASGGGYVRKTLAGKSVTIITDGGRYILYDATDLTWDLASFTGEWLVFYDDTLANDPLLVCHDFSRDLTGGGGSYVYTFTATGGVGRIKL